MRPSSPWASRSTSSMPWRANLGKGFEDAVPWDAGVGRIAATMRHRPDGAVARLALRLAAFHRDLAAQLPEGARALVISHGGVV